MYSPKWLFQIPGTMFLLVGMLCYLLALPGMTIIGITLDAHTMLFGTLAVLVGYQLIQFAVFSKTFAISEGLLPEDPQLNRFFNLISLEKGVVIGSVMFLCGIGLLGFAVNQWRLADFGSLNYAETMRVVIPGMTLAAIGFQTVFSSFFLGILRMKRK